MSRISKGARLVWRPESRKADGSLRNRAGWFIRDGQKFISVGGSETDRKRAEKALASYITDKYKPQRERGRSLDEILIADVINVYLQDIAPKHASPADTATRLGFVLDFFAGKYLSDINGDLCRKFVAKQSTPAYARRQLEDLRSAINHYRKEGYTVASPVIVLPEKSESRERWLTRSEAARLLWAAWRMKQTWKGNPSGRKTGRHVARWMLVALYTGTRSAAICGAAIRPTEGCGYVDLERGVFFRRADGARRTKKRQPPVRLPSRLLAHMRRWRDTDLEIKTQARGKSKNIGRKISQDFVVEWNGEPVQSIKKAFRNARKAAGLGDEVTPHIFRHTAATWLMQAGADVWEAAGFLGMTTETLIETYGHHHPDFQSDAAEKITSKRAIAKAPKNVVRIDERNANRPTSHHRNPTDKPETNANAGKSA
ncbi:tyrosine-type recombinase/integrase [Allomesorhizobium alhagi]|uniref:Phage integrase n=1 Tax=Mesorhizobium alhagi CCNWXJ12-2 TaxID=1107882 RepID=H0I078_9HYPH|nr:site-specific integrase [Mesorhizobium alhagi]EHK53624.1 Phage integrase [Mesorhizobium alhagi CCNWXJ12-2]